MNEEDPYTQHPSELPQPTPPPPVNAGASPSVCPACGAELTGVQIGSACPQCGRIVGASDGMGAPLKTNGMAITSMVMGILSIPACMCYGIPSIPFGVLGLVFAHIGTKQMDQGGYAESSRSMLLAGKICSWIGLTFGLLFLVFFIVMFAIGMANSQSGGQSFPHNTPAQPATPTVVIDHNGHPIASPSSHGWSHPAGASHGNGPNVEVGPDGRLRPALPAGLEYGPGNQVRPSAPHGLQYGPSGQLQPAGLSPHVPYTPPGVPGVGHP